MHWMLNLFRHISHVFAASCPSRVVASDACSSYALVLRIFINNKHSPAFTMPTLQSAVSPTHRRRPYPLHALICR